jgi:hypothetical protein
MIITPSQVMGALHHALLKKGGSAPILLPYRPLHAGLAPLVGMALLTAKSVVTTITRSAVMGARQTAKLRSNGCVMTRLAARLSVGSV